MDDRSKAAEAAPSSARMIFVLSLSIPKMLQRASKRSRAALAHTMSKRSI